MKLYAIGDLHLSGNPPTKPMTIFGEHWNDHWHRIKASWLSLVSAEDTVILCGDQWMGTAFCYKVFSIFSSCDFGLRCDGAI